MPEEMMGVIPNSISVPRLLASIIRSQYRGSEVSEDTIPYRGIWLMTKKMRRVNYRSVLLESVSGLPRELKATYTCPHQLLVKGHLGLRSCHLREEGRKGLDQVKEAN